jgi:hypothetical protein
MSRASTSYFLSLSKDVDGRDKRAFTPVFDGLCPAMTMWKVIVKHRWYYAERGRTPRSLIRRRGAA